MNTALFVGNEVLIQECKKRLLSMGQAVVIHREEEARRWLQDAGKNDCLVIADHCFAGHGEFCDFMEWTAEQGYQPSCMVLVHEEGEAAGHGLSLKYCLSSGIRFVKARSDPKETSMELVRLLNRRKIIEYKRSNTVLFVGTTPNIGTTTTAFGTAVSLAQSSQAQIGYLCLNLKSSKLHRYVGVDSPATTLDGIRSEMKARALTPERLVRYCESFKQIPNLHVLFGNMLREQAEYYLPEDIEHLLVTAESAFDVVVVDVNAYWDNAATVCGAIFAGTKIIVTTPELSHFQEDLNRWVKSLSQVFGLSPEDFDLFVTQRERGQGYGGFSHRDLRKETGLNFIGGMRRWGALPLEQNQGRLLECCKDPGGIAADLKGVVRTLMELYGLEPKPVFRKRWLFRRASAASGPVSQG